MPLQGLEIQAFGGLNLRDDPQDVGFGGAIDLMNVDLSNPGLVRQRTGFVDATLTAGATSPTDLVEGSSANEFFGLVNSGATMQRIRTSGGTTTRTNSGTLVDGITNLASVATPAAGTVIYGGSGTGAGTIVKWNGAAFAYPAVGYAGRVVGVTPWDNRLVLGNTGTNQGTRVRFSDAGTPETFGANNYVDLAPGRGDQIRAMCTWNNQLFVFTTYKFFVFYGTSTDSTGQPIFNYRVVDSGVGAQSSRVGAAPDGVYFVAASGIYRTTGGPPQKLASELDPLFERSPLPSYGPFPYVAAAGSPVAVVPDGDRLYIAMQLAGGTTVTLVRYPSGQWSVWDLPATSMVKTSGAYVPAGVYFANQTSVQICMLSSTATTDSGAAISSRYRTGFGELVQGRQSTMRELVLEGSGSVGVSVADDMAASVPTATTVAISSTTARGRFRKAVRGRTFSISLASVSGGAWTVNRMTPLVRGPRYPGSDAKQ